MTPTANSVLLNTGTATAITGLDNLVAPYLGSAPDVGAYERLLGIPWVGPRSTTNLLAYGLPSGWSVGTISEVGNYQSLGAPASVPANDFRLLLKRTSPTGFILVTFATASGETRWTNYADHLDGEAGDTVYVASVDFRDGFGATVVTRGSNRNLLGARVDDEGLLKVLGGVATADYADQVQEDFFSLVRSLWYAWNLQAISNPITITFVAPPAPGFTSSGSTVSGSGNPITPGILSGVVTYTSLSVIWDVQGDANHNATATVKFRRAGTSTWRNALSLVRVDHTYTPFTRNRLTGSIFRLCPGTTYDIEVVLSDPDGGGTTRTTTFTTRSIAKIVTAGATIEVTTADNIQTVTDARNPGDIVLMHAGTYPLTTYPYWWLGNNGTRNNPILFRAYGDGDVNIAQVLIGGDFNWIDGIKVGNGGLRVFSDYTPLAFTLTRTLVSGTAYVEVEADGDETTVLETTVIGGAGGVSKECVEIGGPIIGCIVAFNDLSAASDGISIEGSSADLHNNKIYDTTDDFIEPDYAWDNIRAWENRCWHVTNNGFTWQPMNGGPWYFTRNQNTGTGYNPFKMRSTVGPSFLVNNTVVSIRQTDNANQMFNAEGVFANNAWMAVSYGGSGPWCGTGAAVVFSGMRFWDYNGYDSDAARIYKFDGVNYSLAGLQAVSVEAHSFMFSALSGSSIPYNKFQQFVEDLLKGVHRLDAAGHVFKVYATNNVPDANLDAVKDDLAEIAAANGYPAGGTDVQNGLTESSGQAMVSAVDFNWNASGGNFGPFRYLVLYNSTPTSPASPLVGWWDYGTSVTVKDGEQFRIDFSTNVFTVA